MTRIRHTYEELVALKREGHEETIDLGYTTIDIQAIEAEIARRDIEANIQARGNVDV